MEYLLKPKNINTLCRICLTPSKTLINLSSPLQETVADVEAGEAIHSMLEKVVFVKVVLNDKLFPSKICSMCMSFLKIAYEFQSQFKQSQEKLEKVIKKAPIEEIVKEVSKNDAVKVPETSIESSVSAPVELIIGGNKFDLNDLVIIEEEEKETFSYSGFLRNLGSEVSAKFVNKYTSGQIQKTDNIVDICTIEQIDREEPELPILSGNIFNNLNISELTVKNCPQDDKIIIEKVDPENKDKNVIVRTLFQCKYCKKISCSKRTHEEHMQVKHSVPSKIYICDQCGHIAKTKSQFRHHMERHWVKDGYKCHICGKRYSSTSHLRYHLSIHQNLRNFLCNVCGKDFNYATSLKYHLRSHSEKQFGCNICGTKFTMPQALKRHLRIHTKERPYPCDYCHKTFPSLGEKKSHELIHTGEKPYKCKYCDKRFTKSVNMQSHCLQHSGPHQCQLCLKGFIDIPTLRLHMRRGHREYSSEFNLDEIMEV